MLVLTRKREEKITIGKNPEIIITILKIQGDKVSIGIEADRNTPVYRSELLKRDTSNKNDPSKTENKAQNREEIFIKDLQINLEQQKNEEEIELVKNPS